jgi:molybdopterin-binding protein
MSKGIAARGWNDAPRRYPHSQGDSMKLSARNQLDGVITEIRKGAVTTIVKIEVRNPAIVSATITNEAVEDLDLRVGAQAVAIIKASDVIVGKP